MTALTPGIAGVGTIVQFVLDQGRYKGEIRPAIIVKIWNNPSALHTSTMVQLQVFTDGTNDFDKGEPGSNGLLWVTSAHYSETGEPRTWHISHTTHAQAKESSS